MVIEIYGIEKATKNYPRREQTIASFATQREADEYIKREKLYQMGYASIGTREVMQETGYKEIGEALGYDPDREKRIREAGRLAEQARIKLGSGQQISTAEAEAAGISKNELAAYNQGALGYSDLKKLTTQQITQLTNLGKAVSSGQLNPSQIASVQEQIINPQAFTKEAAIQRKQEQQRTQEIAERASRQTMASGIFREVRQLPKQFQTPETLRGIAEASIERQKLLRYAVGGSFAETRGGKRKDEVFFIPQDLKTQVLLGVGYGLGISQQNIGKFGISDRSNINTISSIPPSSLGRQILDIQETLGRKQEIAERKRQILTSIGLGTLGIIISSPVGIVKGAISLFTPQFYKQTFELGKRLVLGQSAPEIGEALRIRPAQFIGEFAGFAKGQQLFFKTITKSLKTPKVKILTPAEEAKIASKIDVGKAYLSEAAPATKQDFSGIEVQEVGLKDYLTYLKERRGVAISKYTPPKIQKAQSQTPFKFMRPKPQVVVIEEAAKIEGKGTKPIEVLISDRGNIFIKKAPKKRLTQFTKESTIVTRPQGPEGVPLLTGEVAKDIAKSPFYKIGEASQGKLAGARGKKLSELLGRQEYVLIEEATPIPAEPKLLITYPSLKSLQIAQAIRGVSKPLGILGIASLVAQKSIPISSQIQKPITSTIPIQELSLKQILIPITQQTTLQSPIQDTFLGSMTNLGIQTTQIQRQQQIQQQGLQQQQIQQQGLQQQQILITTILIPPTLKQKEEIVSEKIKHQGYDVYIKSKLHKLRKGKYRSKGFYKANKEPLTRESALGLGVGIVDTYTNRSFVLRKSPKSGRRVGELMQRWQSLQAKFRTAKRNPNILVEKSSYAIDSPEEVRGIPYEAIRQRKQTLKSMATLVKFNNITSRRIKRSVLNKSKSNFMGFKIERKKAIRFL